MARQGGRGRDSLQPLVLCSPTGCTPCLSPRTSVSAELADETQQLRTSSRLKPNNPLQPLESRDPGCRINLPALPSAPASVWGCQNQAALKVWLPFSSMPLSLATMHLSQQEEWQELVPEPSVQAQGRLHTTAHGAGRSWQHHQGSGWGCGGAGCLYSPVLARTSKGRTSFCSATWPSRLEQPVSITWPCTQLEQIFLSAFL